MWLLAIALLILLLAYPLATSALARVTLLVITVGCVAAFLVEHLAYTHGYGNLASSSAIVKRCAEPILRFVSDPRMPVDVVIQAASWVLSIPSVVWASVVSFVTAHRETLLALSPPVLSACATVSFSWWRGRKSIPAAEMTEMHHLASVPAHVQTRRTLVKVRNPQESDNWILSASVPKTEVMAILSKSGRVPHRRETYVEVSICGKPHEIGRIFAAPSFTPVVVMYKLPDYYPDTSSIPGISAFVDAMKRAPIFRLYLLVCSTFYAVVIWPWIAVFERLHFHYIYRRYVVLDLGSNDKVRCKIPSRFLD